MGEWRQVLTKVLISQGALEIGDGYRAKNSEMGIAGLPFVRAGDVNGRVNTVGTDILCEESVAKAREKISFPGDVVITTKGTVGRVAFVREGDAPFVYSPQLCYWRSKNNATIHPQWLFYTLQSTEISHQINWSASQTDMAPYVSLSDQRTAFHLTIPPLAEQEAIAAILGSLDDKIDCNRRMNETLEAMARAIFKDWFVDFGPTRAKMEGRAPYLAQEIWDLFPDSLDDEGKPAGWMACRIGEFAKIGRGASPRPINDYMGGDVPWVKISDATASTSPFIYKTKEFVTKKGSEKSVSRRSGSLILSNSATCGLPYFLGIDACIHDGWLYFDIEDDIQKYTLYFTLAHISEKLIGLADGSVQKNLNIDLVGSQSMIVPGALVLEHFALCAKTFFNRIKNNDIESRTLAQTRDFLLPKLMSGEIRVKDAEKAVGAVL
jgi:type I restriction enzyme S subunit